MTGHADPAVSGIPVFRSESVLVHRVPGASPRSIVTFHHYVDRPADPRSGFGEDFFRRHGVDAVHVISRANDWYQNRDMPAALAAIRAALAGRPALTYGSSMGGYAAIRFAGAVGAERAVALSPQYSIEPSVVPFETRWRKEAARLRFLPWPHEADPPPALAFFDPSTPDARHAALWAAERGVESVPLLHAGHPVTTLLAELGLLQRITLQLLEGRFDRAALLRDVRAGRHRSAEFHAALAMAQPAHRPQMRLALLRRAASLEPENGYLATRLAMQLYLHGHAAEAEDAHRHAVRLRGDDPRVRLRYAVFLQRHGRYGEALDQARAATALTPRFPGLESYERRLRAMRRRLDPMGLLSRAANALHRRREQRHRTAPRWPRSDALEP